MSMYKNSPNFHQEKSFIQKAPFELDPEFPSDVMSDVTRPPSLPSPCALPHVEDIKRGCRANSKLFHVSLPAAPPHTPHSQ